MSDAPDFDKLYGEMVGGAGRGPPSELLKMNEIQFLMILIFDWRRQYSLGIVGPKNRLFQVIYAAIKNKEGIKNLQEYFGGRRISRFANTIDDWYANEYLGYVMEQLQRMMDPRITPSRIK
jgi:hypothetical protein